MPEYGKSPQRISQLTDLQYRVTQQDDTEPSFSNAYWDNKAPGIYVDIVSGEPLFASVDKYDSRTGWPSFTRPLGSGHVVERPDTSHGMVRVEVRSAQGTATSGTCSRTGPATAEDCGTASIPPRSASSPGRIWSRRATVST